MQNKKMQLFIFPYAGGSIAAFKRLTDLIDDRIDVVTVEYAGRGTRVKNALASSIWEFLDDAIEYCRERRNTDIPYSVMGYSMGSVLAYEMVARKALVGKLRHLFISAEVSPKDRSLELRKVENPTEERILERARRLGGLDERMLKNKRFADIYIKPMLSDYRLFFDYRFGDHKEKINVDTTFFYCEKDTALVDVQKWNELIEGQFDFHELGENHFFINQYYEEMARVINNTLCQEAEVLI
ncbi:MAG: hypothetical protein K6F17_08235 [Lachnospiraceae bacterium]|nr:hypothetical protein [Lachnospiraceae bacterium]